MSLNRFPTELPTAEIRVMIDALRGGSKDDAIEAAWWTVGYGATFLPDGKAPPMFAATANPEEELAAQLEGAIAVRGNGGETKALPWGLIVSLAWTVLQKWLQK
jgi:hypothetical protein